MAHIQIDDITPRIGYTVGATAQSVFTIPFPFFANADLLVYVNDELQTLTTHYTVTGAGLNSGGTVTLVSAVTNSTVVIVRQLEIARTTDFPNSGPLDVDALNTDLDRLVAIAQQIADSIDRVPELGTADIDGSGRYDGNGNVYGNAAPGTFSSDLVTVAQLTAATGYVPPDAPDPLPTALQDRFAYNWSTNTTLSDPTDGKIKANNATMASATFLFIAEADGNGNGLGQTIASWVVAPSGTPPRLKLYKISDPTVYVLFRLTLVRSDFGSWQALGVSYITHSGAFADGDDLVVQFLSGDATASTPDWPPSNDCAVRIAAGIDGHSFGVVYFQGNGLWLYDPFLKIWRHGKIQGNYFVVDLHDCTINGVAHQSVAAATQYYIYAYFAAAGDTFMSYELSTTVFGAGDPLGATTVTGFLFKGDGTRNKRLIGVCNSDAAGVFWRAGTRGVYYSGISSYHHRQFLNYHTKVSDGNGATVWTEINSAQYLGAMMWDDGSEPFITLSGSVQSDTAGATVSVGIVIDAETTPFDFVDVYCAVAGKPYPFTITVTGGDFNTAIHMYKVFMKNSAGNGTIIGNRSGTPATGATFAMKLEQ